LSKKLSLSIKKAYKTTASKQEVQALRPELLVIQGVFL
jgi:hypothetical protein